VRGGKLETTGGTGPPRRGEKEPADLRCPELKAEGGIKKTPPFWGNGCGHLVMETANRRIGSIRKKREKKNRDRGKKWLPNCRQ